jgi:pilus assembly protein Flp/PilA
MVGKLAWIKACLTSGEPRQRGQGVVEYALILSLVSLVVIVVLSVLGPSLASLFDQISCALSGDGICDQVDGCVVEDIEVVRISCTGRTLMVEVQTSCPGALIAFDEFGTLNPQGNGRHLQLFSNAAVCDTGLPAGTEFEAVSRHPDGTFTSATFTRN